MISLREETLAMTVWSMYQILGFDTDGDITPDAMIAGSGLDGFCQTMIDAAEQARADHDEALRDESAIRADERRRVANELRKTILSVYHSGGDVMDGMDAVRGFINVIGGDNDRD